MYAYEVFLLMVLLESLFLLIFVLLFFFYELQEEVLRSFTMIVDLSIFTCSPFNVCFIDYFKSDY